MLSVGDSFPSFALNACVSREHGKEFAEITNSSYPGKWLVLFFWPMDFTFVCPTEIAAFGAQNADFAALNAQVLGGSTDSQFVHLAWRNSHKDLQNLPFPMLADVKQELSNALGIIHPQDGVDQRATFIVDPEGIIRWVTVSDPLVGRNVPETLRVLEALQTGERTPCNWEPGQDVIRP